MRFAVVGGARDDAGSVIIDHDARAFDAYRIPVGPLGEGSDSAESEVLEGQVTMIRYLAPTGR